MTKKLSNPLLSPLIVVVLSVALVIIGHHPTNAQFVRTPGATLKLCSFYFGTLQDLGYTYSFHSGRLAAQVELVKRYPDIYIESIYQNEVFTSGMNRTQNVINYVQAGCHMIISNSNDNFVDEDFNDISVWAARTYRNVSFVIGSDSNLAMTWPEPNMIYIGYDLVGAMYRAGVAAAHEATNCIGVLAAFENLIGVDINGFILGVRSVKPTLPVHVVTTNSWYWPDGERRIAEILLNRSCNIIAHETDAHDTDQLVSSLKTFGGGH
eukprot:PhM_4_TR3018/c4_g4_i2/m.89650